MRHMLGVPELILVFWFVLMTLLASVIPFWQISKKAGYSPRSAFSARFHC